MYAIRTITMIDPLGYYSDPVYAQPLVSGDITACSLLTRMHFILEDLFINTQAVIILQAGIGRQDLTRCFCIRCLL